MATTFYDRMRAMAKRQIASRGKTSATFKRYAPTSTLSTGEVDTGEPTVSVPVSVVSFPASKGTIEAFDNRLQDKSLARKVLRYLLIVASDLQVTPQSSDVLEFDGYVWRVLGCTPVAPGDVSIVHGVGVFRVGPIPEPEPEPEPEPTP